MPSPKPNFESSWPVRTKSCVCASTPGVTRIITAWRDPSFVAVDPVVDVRRSSLSISWNESMTIRPTPASTARASSDSDLLLPCSTRRAGGTPADRATCSSPPVETSSHIPSSWASLAMAWHKNALVA